MRAGIAAGGEDGGLVGFGTAIREETLGEFAAGRDPGHAFGERYLRLVRKHSGDVLQLAHLFHDLLVHGLVAVADADGDDAAEEIEVLVAVSVPDELVFGAFDDQRLLEVMEHAGEQVALAGKDDLLLCHAVFITHFRRTAARPRTLHELGR